MKIYNIHKITVATFMLVATAGTFTSCSEMLDLKPAGQFTEEQLTNESVEGLMAAAYAGLESHFFGNNESFSGPITNWVFDVRSDDAYKGGGGVAMEGNIHLLEISNLTSDNATNLNKFRNNYYAISRVHKAMNAISQSSIVDKEQYFGELRTLRAYFYFDLIRVFDRIPYLDEHTNATKARYDEFTRDEIYGFIKADLEYAWQSLPENASQAGRFDKFVAAALMAKVCAQHHDYTETVRYADYVINSGKYELYDNFGDLSKIEFNNKKESILAIQFSTANNNAHINWNNLLNTTYSEGNLFGNGDDFFVASQNLVNAFATDVNGLPYLDGSTHEVTSADYAGNVDPRLDFTVGRIGMPFRGHTYTLGWCRAYDVYGEYSGKKGLIDPSSPDMVQGFPWGASGLNFCLIRYADILLIKAEALVEQGSSLDEARQLVNQVRQKASRSMDAAYTPTELNPMLANYNVGLYPAEGWTVDYARLAVRMERRLELAMEGHRWFDLQRYGNTVEVINNYFRTESALRSYYEGASISQDELFLALPLEEVNNSAGLYEPLK